jgi:hypothetical protein
MRMKPPADLLHWAGRIKSNFAAQLIGRTLVPSKPEHRKSRRKYTACSHLTHCGTRPLRSRAGSSPAGLRWISINQIEKAASFRRSRTVLIANINMVLESAVVRALSRVHSHSHPKNPALEAAPKTDDLYMFV